MLVVSIGLFKAGKEGISWKGALRALESWQTSASSVWPGGGVASLGIGHPIIGSGAVPGIWERRNSYHRS